MVSFTDAIITCMVRTKKWHSRRCQVSLMNTVWHHLVSLPGQTDSNMESNCFIYDEEANCYTSRPTQHHSFFGNLPPLFNQGWHGFPVHHCLHYTCEFTLTLSWGQREPPLLLTKLFIITCMGEVIACNIFSQRTLRSHDIVFSTYLEDCSSTACKLPQIHHNPCLHYWTQTPPSSFHAVNKIYRNKHWCTT